MKKLLFLAIYTLQASSLLFSQEKINPDTMSIILNGEHITLPVPKEGNKTTINLEDSASIIQISVAKISKNKKYSAVTETPRPSVESSGKHTSWFNEVDFALTTMAIQGAAYNYDTGYSYNFTVTSGSPTSQNNDRATVLTLTPKKIYPGFSAGFTIREKSRPIGKGRFYFITGTRFRYTRYTGKGDYDIREIKASTNASGSVTYYPDTVYSVRTGTYRTASNSYSLLFPFLIGTQLKGHKRTSIAAGVNLAINVNATKISENIRENYSIISYVNPQILQLQPIVKASFNRTSVFLSYNIGKTMIGYGATQKLSGNRIYFGMAFKLY